MRSPKVPNMMVSLFLSDALTNITIALLHKCSLIRILSIDTILNIWNLNQYIQHYQDSKKWGLYNPSKNNERLFGSSDPVLTE